VKKTVSHVVALFYHSLGKYI